MKNIFLAVLILSSPVTFFATADDGPLFTCLSPKLTAAEIKKHGKDEFYDTDNKVRGTCKFVEIATVISLDSEVKKDYYLGVHEPLRYHCWKGSCTGQTKYSERLF